jgi:predicted RNA-binding protein with TRAM domain
MEESSGNNQSRPQSFGGARTEEKPVKVGEEMDVTISELSRRGDGVARVQGFVIFVPNAKQGQAARIRITTIRPNFAIAELVNAAT